MIAIDTPDFDSALRNDADGSFHRAVQAFLANALEDLRRQLQQGLSPLEFERAKAIETALLKAQDVIRFSASSSEKP
jgi:hypothetical protein